MFAGTDTTGNLSAMMIYHLSIRPDIQEKLRKEVFDILNGRNVEELQHSDLNKLEYLQCFMNETLRLYSPAPTSLLRRAI